MKRIIDNTGKSIVFLVSFLIAQTLALIIFRGLSIILKTDYDSIITLLLSTITAYIILFSIFYKQDFKLLVHSLKEYTKKRDLLYGLLLGILIVIVVWLISRILPQPNSANNTSLLVQHNMLIAGVFVILIAPVLEEILFRGILVDKVGVVLSSILFSVIHIGSGDLYSIIYPAIITFIIGSVLGTAYKKTKSLLLVILAHSIYNIFILFIFYK